ncbi:MAG TPA: H(+)-transporting ATPase [Verrucomicrobiales bacterium]|jgi:F-type H+-transporting ATPase subunit delta|nr:H(+)-transporting ATPase [Verrucomicrobiales bacterium]HIL68441.1 H(+)-transporting ATPase [Verrucomicrobiota bacterium]
MKISKQTQRDAKQLFRTCLVNDSLEEGRVKLAVTKLIELKPRGYLAILNRFYRLIKLDVAKRTTLVETAIALEDSQKNRIIEALKNQHGENLQITFNTNKELIGGMKVRVGCDVFDSSVQSRLAELESRF